MPFLETNGIALHYRLEGAKTGVPLVFLNSLGSDLRIWDEVAARLAATHQIIRYDKRGHGLSACPDGPYSLADHTADLAGLLAALGIKRPFLIGVSVGGMIALHYALQQPAALAGLVLCDTAAKIGTTAYWDERITAVQQQGLEPLREAILSRWFSPSYAQAHPAAYVGYGQMLTATPAAGYTATCAAIRDADMRPQIATLSLPALVLCGTEDAATTPELVKELADSLPNGRFGLIPHAGHLPSIEQPIAITAQIKAFLQEVAPQSKYDIGMTIRRAVLGDAHVDRAEANQTNFDADFQRFITETAWGTAWAGDSLDRQTRHMLTIAMLAALGKEHELAMHIRATRNTGVTPEQLKEVLQQVAIYAGIPAANTAFGIAKRVYAEMNVQEN